VGGRPCKRVQIFDPLLVPLDPENERATLIALAVLLAPASASDAGDSAPAATNDNHDSADNGQEGEADS
jgi:hypothetical protein